MEDPKRTIRIGSIRDIYDSGLDAHCLDIAVGLAPDVDPNNFLLSACFYNELAKGGINPFPADLIDSILNKFDEKQKSAARAEILVRAAGWENPTFLKVLLGRAYDPSLVSLSSGRNPMALAYAHRRKLNVQLLKESGAENMIAEPEDSDPRY